MHIFLKNPPPYLVLEFGFSEDSPVGKLPAPEGILDLGTLAGTPEEEEPSKEDLSSFMHDLIRDIRSDKDWDKEFPYSDAIGDWPTDKPVFVPPFPTEEVLHGDAQYTMFDASPSLKLLPEALIFDLICVAEWICDDFEEVARVFALDPSETRMFLTPPLDVTKPSPAKTWTGHLVIDPDTDQRDLDTYMAGVRARWEAALESGKSFPTATWTMMNILQEASHYEAPFMLELATATELAAHLKAWDEKGSIVQKWLIRRHDSGGEDGPSNYYEGQWE